MAVEVVFPITDISTQKGRIVKWLKSEGDSVEKGEVIAEIETEKVVTEVESPASGILRKLLVPQGVEIPVLTVIAVITAVDEELPEKYLVELPPVEVAPGAPISQEKVERVGLRTTAVVVKALCSAVHRVCAAARWEQDLQHGAPDSSGRGQSTCP